MATAECDAYPSFQLVDYQPNSKCYHQACGRESLGKTVDAYVVGFYYAD